MKFIKYFFSIILVVLILFQLYPRPEKNVSSAISENDISKIYPMDQRVSTILKKSCYDCHSNNTVYPWYSHIQPFALFLGNHIAEGKRELNFSDFGSYPEKKRAHKMKEIADEIEDGKMPLKSYTIIHGDARLSEEEKQLLIQWAVQFSK